MALRANQQNYAHSQRRLHRHEVMVMNTIKVALRSTIFVASLPFVAVGFGWEFVSCSFEVGQGLFQDFYLWVSELS
jgi:hypothetical protein